MRTATCADETPVFIPSGDHEIFGVLTRPTVEPNGVAVLLLFGGLYTLSINRNRVSVKLARRLAVMGYHVLRLDLHGVGESTGVVEVYDVGRPFADDVAAAEQWMRSQGVEEFVLIGHCYGGRTMLASAEKIGRLRGVGIFSIPVLQTYAQEDYGDVIGARKTARRSLGRLARQALRPRTLARLLRRDRRSLYGKIARAKVRAIRGKTEADTRARVSGEVVRQLEQLVDRGVPILFVYGVEELRWEFDQARSGELDALFERAGPGIDLRLYDDIRLHGMQSFEAQDRSLALVESWLAPAEGKP